MQQELEAADQRYGVLLGQTKEQQKAHQIELDRCKKMREQIQ
jgi:hypothetical protein